MRSRLQWTALLVVAAVICPLAIAGAAQMPAPALSVDGTPIVSARPVSRINNEWFLPLAPIVLAAGAELQTSGNPPQLRVRHSNGVEISYDSRTGDLRSRTILLGRVAHFENVQIIGNDDDLLFPLSGVVTLLGVEIYEDLDRNLLVIQTRGASGAPQYTNGSLLNVGELGYNYGFTTTGKDHGQFLNLRGEVLVGNVRTTEDLVLSDGSGRAPLRLTQGWLRADVSSGRSIVAGDDSTYSGLEAFSNTVRGIGVDAKFKNLASHFYGGRAVSTSFAGVGAVGILRYDTSLAGFNLRRETKGREFVFAANHFDGRDRKGSAAGAGYSVGNRSNQFKIQTVVGHFEGLNSKGAALGASIVDTFNPVKYVTISGQFERYGKNFLSVRDDSRFSGQSNKSVSVTLRPAQHLNLNGGFSDRTFLQSGRRSRNYSYGASGALPGARAVQLSAFRSVQIDNSSALGRFVLDQFSVSVPNLNKYSAYAYYSRVGIGPDTSQNVNLIVLADRGRYGRLGFHDQVQIRNTHRYGVDWSLQSETGDAFVRAGIDRSMNRNMKPALAPVAGLRLPLPHRQTLSLTFSAERNTKMLQIEFGGRVNGRRELARDESARLGVVIAARLTGRVYLDSDFNGSFDSKIDQPISDIAVWLDDETVARTDARGMFAFNQVSTNAHRLRAALDGVPADLVFADPAERTTAVIPNGPNVVTFRAVKAGRITGKVTYLDYSEDPAKPVERAIGDVRVVATGDRDTFSELNGGFLISDLPPGSYELKIDPTSIPALYLPQPATARVEVLAGKTSNEVHFQLVIPPRPVNEKTLPVQASR